MAHSPNKTKSIDGSRETLKLAVRITDLWFIWIPNKSEQAEMVIVDSDVWFYSFFYCYIIDHSISYLYILYIIGR